jgi:hypothetical protein
MWSPSEVLEELNGRQRHLTTRIICEFHGIVKARHLTGDSVKELHQAPDREMQKQWLKKVSPRGHRTIRTFDVKGRKRRKVLMATINFATEKAETQEKTWEPDSN